MEILEKESSARWEAGRSSDGRISPRRRTLARVRLFEGPALGEGIIATDLSADGAFLRSANAGGLGERVRLEEVPARDRSRLRGYAGFYEMDEAIVRVQRTLGDVISGNLLPLGERS